MQSVVDVQIQLLEVTSLHGIRVAQTEMPNVSMRNLRLLDGRLVAHLDRLDRSNDATVLFIEQALADPSAGAVFLAVVQAIEGDRADSLHRLLTLSTDLPTVRDGLTSGLAWVEQRHLQRVVRDLLVSEVSARREVGVAVCAGHRVDPGLAKGPWLDDPSPDVRVRALRAVGELGLKDLSSRAVSALADSSPDCRFWAAWAAVLLGGRGPALDLLRRTAISPDMPHQARAFRLALQAMDTSGAHSFLQLVGQDKETLRRLIEGSGVAGDPTYVTWLVGHMSTPETARLAGEAFTLITGADLDSLQLWRQQPEGFESGPTDDPDDPNVAMDPDEGLPWPDQEKVEKWWAANGHRFQKGQRYFLGAPVTRAHCIDVLKHGYQRQRVLAAHYLCLLNPGTPLFNTSAPAWRQQRLLAQMV